MTQFLALMVRNDDGWSGSIPELLVIAAGDTRDEVEQALSEGLALYLEDEPDTKPAAQRFADLPADVREDYKGLDPVVALLTPAAMNPVSLEVARAIEASGLSYRELARRMNTGHASISRMTNPFYWGHGLPMLRRLAKELNLNVDVKLSAELRS